MLVVELNCHGNKVLKVVECKDFMQNYQNATDSEFFRVYRFIRSHIIKIEEIKETICLKLVQ